MFVDPQWSWPVILDRVAQPVQRTDTGIATPGKSQCARTTSANQLIVDKVWRHPDQMEIVFFWRKIPLPAANGIRWGEPSSANALPLGMYLWMTSLKAADFIALLTFCF